ncbi:MAG: methyltransferase domain-containing protein [Anaerolineae bacterium]|nr:methyltransferase domain-containing protein [Anaerolineae bacterium]
MPVFYEARNTPVHSVLLLTTQEEAINYPTGDIALGHCERCGFISNVLFDPNLHEYSARYEATQSYSPTFSAFSRQLATSLIEKHNLRGKRIIEIGCGQGEFLTELCELGNNQGVGFDPAYVQERSMARSDRVSFVTDFYSEKYTNYTADLIVCKMTLEHIGQTADFVRTVRRSVGDNSDSIVFFQIPNAVRVLQDVAFWDIYYEHCSYFSRASLAYLFRSVGFEILDIWTEYDDQYLMIDARVSVQKTDPATFHPAGSMDELTGALDHFKQAITGRLDHWRAVLADLRQAGKRAVIWGGGSKGVAFLTTLDIRDEIKYVVDINPHKRNMYMAGTGQKTVAPEFLKDYRPDVVIVMNPIYCDEIQRSLDDMGVAAQLMPV